MTPQELDILRKLVKLGREDNDKILIYTRTHSKQATALLEGRGYLRRVYLVHTDRYAYWEASYYFMSKAFIRAKRLGKIV